MILMKLFLNISILLILLAACKKDACMKSRGDTVEISNSFEQIRVITVHDHIFLNLFPSDRNEVVVRAGENLQAFIKVNNEQGRLEFRDNNRCNWLRSFKENIEVDIYFSDGLDSLINFSSADIQLMDTLRNNLVYEAFGATGDAHLLIHSDSIQVFAETGPHDVYLYGQVDYSYFYHSGFGNIHAYELESVIQHSNNSSTGDFYVRATELLIAEVRSLGNIYYKGQPQEIKSTIEGKGDLIKD